MKCEIPGKKVNCTKVKVKKLNIIFNKHFYFFQNYLLALEENSGEKDAELLLSLGSVYHAMGQLEKAWGFYTQSWKLQPNNKILQTNMQILARTATGQQNQQKTHDVFL